MARARANKILIAGSDCANVLRTKVETGPALQVNEQLATSGLLFLAEFLETWILAERIEHWIEPEQSGSERHG